MMPDVDERIDRVEGSLKSLGERMAGGFEQVDRRFGTLESEVQKLRVLAEENATQIKQVAEVQAHQGSVLHGHSQALQRLEDALEPLKVLPAALQTVLPEYERRITALERKC